MARMRTALRHRMQRRAEVPLLKVGGLARARRIPQRAGPSQPAKTESSAALIERRRLGRNEI